MSTRIRSLKPGIWDDYEFGTVSIGAELIFMGLITRADDDGYLLGSPKWLNSQLFPHKEDVENADIKGWLDELGDAELIVLFEVEKKPYIWLPNWHKHQKMDPRWYKPTERPLAPTDAVTESAQRDYSERSRGARRERGERTPQERSGEEGKGKEKTPSRNSEGKGRGKKVDQDALPNGFDPGLTGIVNQLLPRLEKLAEQKGTKPVTLRAVGLIVQSFPDRNHAKAIADLEFWATSGNGENRTIKDMASQYRTFASNADKVAQRKPAHDPYSPAAGYRV